MYSRQDWTQTVANCATMQGSTRARSIFPSAGEDARNVVFPLGGIGADGRLRDCDNRPSKDSEGRSEHEVDYVMRIDKCEISGDAFKLCEKGFETWAWNLQYVFPWKSSDG